MVRRGRLKTRWRTEPTCLWPSCSCRASGPRAVTARAPGRRTNPSRSSWISTSTSTWKSTGSTATADYRGISDAVRAVIEEGSFDLIEVMARRRRIGGPVDRPRHAGDSGGAQAPGRRPARHRWRRRCGHRGDLTPCPRRRTWVSAPTSGNASKPCNKPWTCLPPNQVSGRRPALGSGKPTPSAAPPSPTTSTPCSAS